LVGLAVVGGFGVAKEAGAADPSAVAAAPNLLPAVPPDPGVSVPPDPGASAVVADPAAPGRKGVAAPAKPPSLLAPLPAPPPAQAEAYELRRADDGSGDLLYRAPGFDARIHRDGSVRFTDRHVSLNFLPWLPYRTNAGTPTLQSILSGVLLKPAPVVGGARGSNGVAGTTNGGIRAYAPPPAYVPAISPFRPDPNEGCRYPKPCFFDASVVLLSVAGTFDLTDELMRLGGQDPYRYEKARFMKGTGELRSRLAARAHADDLRAASDQLPRHLEDIAGDRNLTPAERRATIEALGLEMDATTPEGRKARALIDAFVRARFSATPAASPSPGAPSARPASSSSARPSGP